MQVFRAFYKLAWSYKIGILLYFGICVLMTFMVASQYDSQKTEKKYGNESYHLAVVDEDHSTLSRALIQFLKKQHTVEKKSYAEETVKDLLYYQEIGAYITIPEGFEKHHLEGNAIKVHNLSDEGQAAGAFINMQVSYYLEGVARLEKAGSSLEDAISGANESNDFSNFVELQGKEEDSKETNSKLYSLFLFLPYPVMSIILFTVLPVILVFNNKDIKDRTLISAINPFSRNIALVAGDASVSFLVFLGLLIFTSFFLQEDVFGSRWFLAAANLLVFTIVTAMLLLLIASFSFLGIQKSKDVITNIIALGFSFLGGIFVPLRLLGNGVKTVGKFLPTYWYAVSLEKIDKGAGVLDILGGFSMELLFGVVCLALGMAVSSVSRTSKI